MEVFAGFGKLALVALALGSGVVFARYGVIAAQASKAFTDFAFLLAVPCYLFVNIAGSDPGRLFTWWAILGYALTAIAGMTVVATVTWLTTSRKPRDIALRAMAGTHVNTAYFAVPVFITLFGTAAPIFPILLLQVCVLALAVIFVMELDTGTPRNRVSGRVRTERPKGSGGTLAKLGRALGAALSTPVVLACNTGLAVSLLPVALPGPLIDGFTFVGDAASPVALFALGLHLGSNGLGIRDTTLEQVWLIAVKCLAFPLVMWLTCGYVIGVRGEWLTYLVLIAAMPAPQNLFVYAQRYGVGVDLSASLVVKSSATALLLLPLWAYWTHAV